MEQAQQARARTVEKLDLQRRQRVAQLKTNFAALNEPERELSRDLFVANFLPYFCGEQATTKEVLRAWLNVASSPFHAVRLVENGKTIGIVPPIQEHSTFKPISGDDRRTYNTGAILEMSAQRAGIDPVSSIGTMNEGLTNRFLSDAPEIATAHRKAWEELLAIFGKSLDPTKSVAASSKSGNELQSDEPLEDYE
jgi:hypothetical protein